MAIKKRENKPNIPATLKPEQAIPLIQRQIDRIAEIRTLKYDDPKEESWLSTTVNILNGVFGQPNGEYERRTADIAYAQGGPLRIGMSEYECQNNHVNRCDKRKALLEAYIEQLRDSCPMPIIMPVSNDTVSTNTQGSCVFLVHGRATGAVADVARFLEKLDLPVTILHEQPNEGQTIIEKFEKHAGRSNYAVVLLTGDDEGRLKSDTEFNSRARQNVILELGYFMGKISRKNVCAIYESGVELPSDYDGVLYIPLDTDGAWKYRLAKELKANGLDVDLNKA